MANSTDKGNQVLRIKFQQNLTSQEENQAFHNIVPAGIYEGFTLTTDGTDVIVAEGTALVDDYGASKVSIKVETTTPYSFPVSSTEPIVVVNFEWVDASNNFVDIIAKSVGALLPTDIVLGEALFSGPTIIGFDYTLRDSGQINRLDAQYSDDGGILFYDSARKMYRATSNLSTDENGNFIVSQSGSPSIYIVQEDAILDEKTTVLRNIAGETRIGFINDGETASDFWLVATRTGESLDTMLLASNGGKVIIRTNTDDGSGSTFQIEGSATFGVSPSDAKIHIDNNSIGFNRNIGTGAIFDSSYSGFQLSRKETDDSLRFEVYNSSGVSVESNALKIHADGHVSIGAGLQTDNVILKTKIIELGGWNMDTTATRTITHGLTFQKIRFMTASIQPDALNFIFPFATTSGLASGGTEVDGWISNATSTSVKLIRKDGGNFDNTSYINTGINRGWLTIIYEV